MNSTDILNQAREIIERDGWIQGEYYELPESNDPKVQKRAAMSAPVCGVGGLARAITGSAEIENTIFLSGSEAAGEAVRRLGASIIATVGEEFFGGRLNQLSETGIISTWNDAKTTSKEDVILAFKKAAEA